MVLIRLIMQPLWLADNTVDTTVVTFRIIRYRRWRGA